MNTNHLNTPDATSETIRRSETTLRPDYIDSMIDSVRGAYDSLAIARKCHVRASLWAAECDDALIDAQTAVAAQLYTALMDPAIRAKRIHDSTSNERSAQRKAKRRERLAAMIYAAAEDRVDCLRLQAAILGRGTN